MEQDLKRKVIALRDQWQADRVVVEKANTGYPSMPTTKLNASAIERVTAAAAGLDAWHLRRAIGLLERQYATVKAAEDLQRRRPHPDSDDE